MSYDVAALQRHFGYSQFRPGQGEAIRPVLAGQDTLVVMPTGAGKSLIYQLPALESPGSTLVISPLVALMKDQVDSLVALGKAATYINSSLTADEQQTRIDNLAAGKYKLIYIAPERLRNRVFMQTLRQSVIDRVAVDEAHCISQWGHDFRPDYLNLGAMIEALGKPPIVALTATATPQVQDDIVTRLNLRQPARIVTGFNRPNLTFEVRATPDDATKLRDLHQLLDAVPGPAIVYTGTRKDAEQVSAFLSGLAIASTYYHAGLSPELRRQVQDRFMADEARVIVATNAFGMGVDKSDIRLVAHYSLPSTLEAYYQEAGRAGRDQTSSRCVLLYSPKDRALQEWFIENDAPNQYELRGLMATLRRLARDRMVRVSENDLMRLARLNDVKLRVGLSQLGQLGAIVHLGDDLGAMSFEIQADTPDIDLSSTASEVMERRQHKHHKLAQMVEYAELTSCRRRFILDYFGDTSPAEAARCCDICLAQLDAQPTATSAETTQTTEEEALVGRQASTTAEWTLLVILEAVKSISNGVNKVKLALFLTGSKSSTLGGLTRHRLYGKLKYLGSTRLQEIIDQLVAGGYLKLIGADTSTIVLTPRGNSALRSRAAIDLID